MLMSLGFTIGSFTGSSGDALGGVLISNLQLRAWSVIISVQAQHVRFDVRAACFALASGGGVKAVRVLE